MIYAGFPSFCGLGWRAACFKFLVSTVGLHKVRACYMALRSSPAKASSCVGAWLSFVTDSLNGIRRLGTSSASMSITRSDSLSQSWKSMCVVCPGCLSSDTFLRTTTTIIITTATVIEVMVLSISAAIITTSTLPLLPLLFKFTY